MGRIEYGVRNPGGHVEAKISLHVAVREIEQKLANGSNPLNTYLVKREVTDWRPADERG